MEKLFAPEVSTKEEALYGQINCSFFRLSRDGEVLFGTVRSENGPVYCFRVLKNKTVMRTSDVVALWPNQIVQILDHKDLGIEKIIWSN